MAYFSGGLGPRQLRQGRRRELPAASRRPLRDENFDGLPQYINPVTIAPLIALFGPGALAPIAGVFSFYACKRAGESYEVMETQGGCRGVTVARFFRCRPRETHTAMGRKACAKYTQGTHSSKRPFDPRLLRNSR